MRLAYLIIAHQQPEQLAQMLYCIQHPDNVYLVMPDSKGLTGSEPALQAVVRRHPNVFIAPARDMRWASWSLMQARLDGIRELLARPEPWEVLINLSGQDFPLKSQEEIRAFFAANEGRNFLDIVEPEKVWNDPYARIQRIRLEPPFMKIAGRAIWARPATWVAAPTWRLPAASVSISSNPATCPAG